MINRSQETARSSTHDEVAALEAAIFALRQAEDEGSVQILQAPVEVRNAQSKMVKEAALADHHASFAPRLVQLESQLATLRPILKYSRASSAKGKVAQAYEPRAIVG